MPARHTAVVLATLGLAGCLFPACAVRPQPDFDRTAAQIRQHTESPDVYDPSADGLIEERVSAILHNGLTVDEAVRVALLNNPDFQSLFFTIGASRADVVQSGLLSNPTLGLAILYPSGGGRSKITAGIAQQIVDLWQIPIRKQIAEADLEQLVLNVVQSGVEIAGQARIDGYRLLAFEMAEQYAVENVEIVRRSLAISDKRVKEGETSELDSNIVRATLTEANLELESARRDVRVARASLGRTLGLSCGEQDWRLVDELPATDKIIGGDAELVAYGLSQRTDIQAKNQQVAAAVAELNRQCLNVFPNIQVGIGAEQPATRGVPGRTVLADTARASVAAGQLTAPNIQSRAQRDLLRRQIIDFEFGPTLQMTLPVFDQNQAQIARAEYTVKQRHKELLALRNAVAEQIQQSCAIAEIAARQVRYYERDVLPLARENLDASEQAYRSGDRDELFVLQTQQFLINRRRGYIRVLNEYAAAYAALERAVGGRMPVETTSRESTTRNADLNSVREE